NVYRKNIGGAGHGNSEHLSSSSHARETIRVLVVEDDRDLGTLHKVALEGMGCVCHTAENGEEALDLCTVHDYNAILMDCHLPGMNGCEAVARIRCSQRNATVPIIGCSGEESFRAASLAAGMNAFVTKPLSIIELAGALSQIGLRKGEP
ncbi:MAG: response regulator, partial [Candidatus Hydrogenedentes bacterium]|nr:response regulator [Candidatus Hydrogenedentota bacterium]